MRGGVATEASTGRALPTAPGHADDDTCDGWAQRHGFAPTRPGGWQDFKAVLRLASCAEWRIEPGDLQQGNKVDEGAFGSIFAGCWRGAAVAIKRVTKVGTKGSYERIFRDLRRELEILAELKHPNVVSFYGIAAFFPARKQEDAKFSLGFVFELCDFCNLYALLHQKRALKKKDFLPKMRIVEGIANGMAYVHQHRILHRDLSSRNVLLTSAMDVKVCDFGLARKLECDYYDPNTISGSPAYMAPEQLHGEDKLSLKADVYSIGIIMWEILNNQVPWYDFGKLNLQNNRKGLSDHIKRGGSLRRTPLHEITCDVAAATAVGAIMDRALHTHPDDRHSMQQMHTLLRTVIEEYEETIAKSAQEQKRFESLLRRFYITYNPANLERVKKLAREWKSCEQGLNEKLRAVYNADLTDLDSLDGINVYSASTTEGRHENLNAKDPSHGDALYPMQVQVREEGRNESCTKSPSSEVAIGLDGGELHVSEAHRDESMEALSGEGSARPGDKACMRTARKTRKKTASSHLLFRAPSSPSGNLCTTRYFGGVSRSASWGTQDSLEGKNVSSHGSEESENKNVAPDRNCSQYEEVPDSDQVAELLRQFYQVLNPTKIHLVPALLSKFADDYDGLNMHLQRMHQIDLRSELWEIEEKAEAEKGKRELVQQRMRAYELALRELQRNPISDNEPRASIGEGRSENVPRNEAFGEGHEQERDECWI